MFNHNNQNWNGRDDPRVRTVRFETAPRSIFLILAVIAGILIVARLWQIILMLIIALVLIEERSDPPTRSRYRTRR